ncbi:DUF3413 domain-containing protein [Psychrosphaera ytuae]|uniref:DUF3413 domain-containing protein n=1 Tax=Psychrosphaera ytuae TaxID=2820710 RepID=A0A975HI81_9GAMM|nr:DUF3413 domain-containing protein [Psychrosphaera ytuae]QTH63976.1 DUF3413 domain-containing protein [Psychrosphaera ytuae]
MVIKLKSQWETEQPFNLLSWGHWFTFANLILALLFSSFYMVDYTMPETFAGWLYLVLTWVGHFSFLALSCFILTIFPVITIFPYKRHIRGVSAVMASIFQLYLFLDVLAYRGLGYHLTSSSFKQIREVEDVYVAMMGDSYFLMVLTVFVFILAYQFLVSNLTWKRIHQLQSFKYKNGLASSLIGAFFLSHFFHIWGDATLNSDIAKQSSMFPAHYPLTAKTLLARYELIDLQEYKSSQSNRAVLSESEYRLIPTQVPSCDFEDQPKLNVVMLPIKQQLAAQTWIKNSNLKFSFNKELNVPSDLSSLIFNFSSGLPGLYEDFKEQVNINKQLSVDLLSVQLMAGDFDPKSIDSKISDKLVVVFYDEDNESPFYRTNVLLVGFEHIPQAPFSPQNIVASYLADGLGCKEYVKRNLIDLPFSEFDTHHIVTHYSSGYFQFVYKDNALLFKNGKLLTNKTFSSNKDVNATVDVRLIEEAVSNLTKRRLKISQ